MHFSSRVGVKKKEKKRERHVKSSLFNQAECTANRKDENRNIVCCHPTKQKTKTI